MGDAMYQSDYVCDAIPDAKSRLATADDYLLHIHGDGTVTIPTDVEVIDLDDCLWFRTSRLRGWNGTHKQSPIMGDPMRTIEVAVREEMTRTGRTIQRWTQLEATNARKHDTAYWDRMDAVDVRT